MTSTQSAGFRAPRLVALLSATGTIFAGFLTSSSSAQAAPLAAADPPSDCREGPPSPSIPVDLQEDLPDCTPPPAEPWFTVNSGPLTTSIYLSEAASTRLHEWMEGHADESSVVVAGGTGIACQVAAGAANPVSAVPCGILAIAVGAEFGDLKGAARDADTNNTCLVLRFKPLLPGPPVIEIEATKPGNSYCESLA